MSNSRAILLGLTLIAIGMALACGGQSATLPSSGSVSVTISPTVISADQGAGVQFSASVLGASNQAVNWSIGEGSAGGSITQNGLFTAPAAAIVVHVLATSIADPS